MYSICFTIAGLVFGILLFILYNFKSNLKLLENKIYYGIIVTSIISSLTEVYSFVLVSNNIDINSNLYLFSLKFLFLTFIIWLYLFMLYTIIVTINLKNKDYTKYKTMLIVSVSIITIASFIIMKLPININDIGGMFLPTGIGVDIIYVLAGLIFIIMISVLIIGRENLKNKKYYPMYFLLVMLGIIILVQKIFPSLLLINFSLSILIYVMYFTMENPDIRNIKELNYTKKLLEKQNEMVSNTINNLAISLKKPLMEIVKFSKKSSSKDLEKFQSKSIEVVDQINKIMDLTRIENRELKIKNRLYQTDNLINSIKDMLNLKNIEVSYNINDNIPEILYGDDDNIKQSITYLVEFINNYFDKYSLTINISKLSVRNNCKLIFDFIVDYKNTNLTFIERNNRCEVTSNAWEYELYTRLVELQKGNTSFKRDNYSLVFSFSLFQTIEDSIKKIEEDDITYTDYSNKRVLVALDNHNDINKMVDLLVNYNVDITTASSISELHELVRSDKTFDLVFLSDTISGIENYNINTIEDLLLARSKISLVAGYKLDIIILTLSNYKDNGIEYLKIPISKVELDDIMVKYLSEN